MPMPKKNLDGTIVDQERGEEYRFTDGVLQVRDLPESIEPDGIGREDWEDVTLDATLEMMEQNTEAGKWLKENRISPEHLKEWRFDYELKKRREM